MTLQELDLAGSCAFGESPSDCRSIITGVDLECSWYALLRDLQG